jgi:predicted HTH domain antitoxin
MKDDIMHETTIALSLPVDVATALWGRKRSETGRHERIKTLIAVGLFAEGAISLAKASALAGVNRYEFALLLKRMGLPAYDHTESEYAEDANFAASVLDYHRRATP